MRSSRFHPVGTCALALAGCMHGRPGPSRAMLRRCCSIRSRCPPCCARRRYGTRRSRAVVRAADRRADGAAADHAASRSRWKRTSPLHARLRRQAARRRVRPGRPDATTIPSTPAADHHAADRRGAGARPDPGAACSRDRRAAAPGLSSASRTSRSRSRPTGRSSCSARSPCPASIPTSPT